MHEERYDIGLLEEHARGAAVMETEQGARWGIARAHAAQRSLVPLFGFLALALLFVGLTFVPAVASLLGVHRGTALAVVGVWLGCMTAATTAYHLSGYSRLYRLFDAIESLGIQAGVCLFVYRSGGAVSIFWLAYLAHAQLLASVGYCAQNLAIIASGPATLTLVFWLNGDKASALLSLLIGAMGAHVYSTLARVHSSLEASRAREAQLENRLARLRLAEERGRIARDLHDGVGGELAALMWRLRRVPMDADAKPLDAGESELGHLEGRIRRVLENLRRVVLDLREEHRSWVDTLAALRERCYDLCAGRQLDFSVAGALGGPLAPNLAADIECIVSELVRNAVTHGSPLRVEVRIRIGEGIEVSVSDDGTGLAPEIGNQSSGGLANVRARVTRLGGKLDIRTANSGTHLEVYLPGVVHEPNSAAPAGQGPESRLEPNAR
jgi:signal transduction histidine kinase